MSNQIELKEAGEGVHQEQKKGWLKKLLPMGICCTAPFLVALAIPVFGLSVAGVAGVLLPLLALLACPLGMYFMMRTMNKK